MLTMKLKYEFVVQEVGESFVAVAVGDDAAKFSGLIRMNQTGKDIFELLKDGTTEEGIVSALLERYDGPEQVVQEKVYKFVKSLSREGIVE